MREKMQREERTGPWLQRYILKCVLRSFEIWNEFHINKVLTYCKYIAFIKYNPRKTIKASLTPDVIETVQLETILSVLFSVLLKSRAPTVGVLSVLFVHFALTWNYRGVGSDPEHCEEYQRAQLCIPPTFAHCLWYLLWARFRLSCNGW